MKVPSSFGVSGSVVLAMDTRRAGAVVLAIAPCQEEGLSGSLVLAKVPRRARALVLARDPCGEGPLRA